MLSKATSSTTFWVCGMTRMGLNHGLPEHSWRIYSLGQWWYIYIAVYSYLSINISKSFHIHPSFYLSQPDHILVISYQSISLISSSSSSSSSSSYYYYYYYYYYYSFRVFHISVSWWFFPGVWVTASLLKSPGLFSIFYPFLIMWSFGWSPLGRSLPSLLDPLIIF